VTDPITSRRCRYGRWKALIVLAELPGANPLELEKSPRVIDDVLADHKASA